MAEKLRAVTSGSGNLIPRLDVVFGCQFALLIDSCLHTCSGDPVDGVKDDSKRQYPTLASIIFASWYSEAGWRGAESITLLAESTHPLRTEEKRPAWGIELFDVESPPTYSGMPE